MSYRGPDPTLGSGRTLAAASSDPTQSFRYGGKAPRANGMI